MHLRCPLNLTPPHLSPLFRLLQAAFRLLYHPFAWAYDLVAAVVSVGMWKDWVYTVLPELSGPRVLELGFGPGHLQVKGNERALQIVGVDESMQMCRQARGRLTRSGYASKVSRGLGQELPFRAGYFDQVVATFPAPYITAPETLAEIRRVLAPEGALIILPGAIITGKSLFDRLASGLFRITHQSPEDATILEGQAKATFANTGFSVQLKQHKTERSTTVQIIAKKTNADNHST